MHQLFWRYSLSLITILALFIALGDAVDRGRIGSTGLVVRAVSDNDALVTQVAAGSFAAHAGVRAGDRISADWIRPIALLSLSITAGFRAGEPITFRDVSSSRTITLTSTSISTLFSPPRILAHVLRILSLLFALVLFWCRPEDRAARALGAFLLLFNLQGWGDSGSFIFPVWVSQVFSNLSQPLTLLMLALFACWFPDRYPRDSRKSLAASATIFAGAMLLIRMVTTSYAYWGTGLHLSFTLFRGLTIYSEPAFFGFVAIAALIVDFRTASQLDRRRLEWVTVGMALQAYGFLSVSALPNIFVGLGGVFNNLGLFLSDVGQMAGTVCLLYGFMRYRVLDFGFAINRATVFAVVSTIIVGLFVLMEYVISKFVDSQSHVTGVAITLGAAVAIGISLRTIHRHVDRLVDNVIFRQRHHDEQAIRAFGRRARFINDERILLERTIRELDRHARADGSAVYLRTEAGDYARAVSSMKDGAEIIDRNDPGLLLMKDTGTTCYIDEPTAATCGELLLPMWVLGELSGFAACGRARVREMYAPDELEAMAFLVERVGIQVDALRTTRMQNMITEIGNLVRAHLLAGGDATKVIAHIAGITRAL